MSVERGRAPSAPTAAEIAAAGDVLVRVLLALLAPSRGDLVSHAALAEELGVSSKRAAAIARCAGGRRLSKQGPLLVSRAALAAMVAADAAGAPESAAPPSRRRTAMRTAVDADLAELGFEVDGTRAHVATDREADRHSTAGDEVHVTPKKRRGRGR